MKRPNIEDYNQSKTGESLMNGPYNQTKYAEALDKYIDYLEGPSTEISEIIEQVISQTVYTLSIYVNDWFDSSEKEMEKDLEKLKSDFLEKYFLKSQ